MPEPSWLISSINSSPSIFKPPYLRGLPSLFQTVSHPLPYFTVFSTAFVIGKHTQKKNTSVMPPCLNSSSTRTWIFFSVFCLQHTELRLTLRRHSTKYLERHRMGTWIATAHMLLSGFQILCIMGHDHIQGAKAKACGLVRTGIHILGILEMSSFELKSNHCSSPPEGSLWAFSPKALPLTTQENGKDPFL